MWIDFHSHILPGMDDGASDVETSLKMLRSLRDQGVEYVALTPHFYAHRESIEQFLERRETAYKSLLEAIGDEKLPQLRLGAEVALECDLDEVEGLDRLAIEGTPFLLLELPIYRGYMPWMAEQIASVCAINRKLPMLAHLDRYIGFYSNEELDRIALKSGALIQVNVLSMLHWTIRKRVLRWIKARCPLVFGSDAHNMRARKPRFEAGMRALGRRVDSTAMERIQMDSQLVLRGGCPDSLLKKESGKDGQ